MHFFTKAFALTCLLGLPQAATATAPGNYAEMILPLVTMVAEMSANHYQFHEQDTQADSYKKISLFADLANKLVFFANNYNATRGVQDSWAPGNRDCVANGAIAVADLVKLTQTYTPQKPTAESLLTSITNAPEEAAAYLAKLNATQLQRLITKCGKDFGKLSDQKIAEEINSTIKISQNKKRFTAQYATDVVVLPLLKALTAYMVACTQNYATSWSGDRARYAATAAHTLTHLLDMYTKVDNANHQKLLAQFIGLNLAWLAGESRMYLKEQAALEMHSRFEACSSCGVRRCTPILECNHSRTCNTCLKQTALLDGYQTQCTDPGCDHILSRNEICFITKNDPAAMQNYDKVVYAAAHTINNIPPAQQVLEDPADCPICYDKKPLCALACCDGKKLHAFCVSCLQDHINTHGRDNTLCPLCCESYKIPAHEVAKIMRLPK